MPPEIEQLFREHRAGLVRLVERELHDRHDAEDVVQTAFLDAQCALERGTIPRNPRAWLAAIALNAGRRLRRRRLNAEPLEEYAAQESAGMPGIRAALASLPREQRAAVVYRDVLGLTYGETAEQMGTSVNSVTMLLHRGRRRLRQTLGLTAGGIGLWRWLKRAGMPQVAVAKGTAAVVVATGLATTGIVAAHVVAPVETNVTAAAAATHSASSRTHTTGRTHDHARSRHSARDVKKPGGTLVSAVPAPAQGSSEDPSPTTARSTTAEAASALLHSTLRLPTVSVPTLQVSTPAVTVAVSTPVATVTVATPTGTTVTVPTPITTVTLPIP